MRTERQAHGFVFEEYVEKEFGVNRSGKTYTDSWDGELNGKPVSIKTAKLGSDVELADFRRNALNTQDFYLIVGFWEGSKTNIVKVEKLLINGSEWHTLFPQHFIADFAALLASVTNDKSDDAKWRSLITAQRKQWQAETGNLIRPRFKRDHKTQKRIQCAINYKDFYNYFVPKYNDQEGE